MSNSPLDRNLSASHQGRLRRIDRPERIVIGGETMVRNDVLAREGCTTVRTLNRGDRLGAPFVYLHGVKYRPKERHDAFLLSQIQTRKPTPSKRWRKSP